MFLYEYYRVRKIMYYLLYYLIFFLGIYLIFNLSVMVVVLENGEEFCDLEKFRVNVLFLDA